MGEIAKFIDNGKILTLPVKALFTSKPAKPVLPVFTSFYQFLPVQIINPSREQPRSAARLSKMPVPSYELCAPFPSLSHATTANYGLLPNLRGNPELPQAEF